MKALGLKSLVGDCVNVIEGVMDGDGDPAGAVSILERLSSSTEGDLAHVAEQAAECFRLLERQEITPVQVDFDAIIIQIKRKWRRAAMDELDVDLSVGSETRCVAFGGV